jgi:DNA repair protein RecN (Recombination protein N)
VGRLDQRAPLNGPFGPLRLRRLTIEDYGLIARADVEFADGATMFTGETGSGKTMLLGALGFVFGSRAGADVVRRGRTRAGVVLEFEPDAALRERLAADGYAVDPDEIATIGRELHASGKSTVRVNGRPSTAAYVRELAAELADVVGQHEAQRLLSPAYHVELLDRYGGAELTQARERVSELYARRKHAADALAAIASGERRAAEQCAFATYALQEIEAAAPQSGEDEHLTARRSLLDNAEKIALALRTAHDALAGEESSAADALGSAASSLGHIAGFGAQFAHMSQNASAMQSEVNDLAVQIGRALDEIEFDPGELEAVNSRLDALDTLKRKYGGTLEAVLQAAAEFRATVELFANQDERRTQVARELEAAAAQLEEAAEHLSRLRHGVAYRLTKAIEHELKDLALPSGRFSVQFEPLAEIGPDGAERAEFVFAANKGDELRPLARVASGGELSRVLLALVVALAAARGRTALIFDEIDAGIGGATATSVGARLGRLARHAQVICVTHLAQIACWADAHYTLDKKEGRSSTTIEVREIGSKTERIAELARMLSGEAHDTALRHARALLDQTQQRRTAIASVSS